MNPKPLISNTDGGDYPPLSALNDLAFCRRRCALHRLENLWVESFHTIHGTLLHDRVHTKGIRNRLGRTEFRGLRIVSHTLRLQGVADMVEYHDSPAGSLPYPVEYKRGKAKAWDNDDIQVCAQAVCLEEMLHTEIPKGAIYHVRSKTRREVVFNSALRAKTASAAKDLNDLVMQQALPPPVLLPHCQKCSLRHRCQPRLTPKDRSYIKALSELYLTED